MRILLLLATTWLSACSGPAARCNLDTLDRDSNNCGACGNQCQAGDECSVGVCRPGACEEGTTGACYSGTSDTKDVGLCQGGTRTCLPGGTWSRCEGEVLPVAEICGNGLDENCSGAADEDTDLDGDGFSTCAGDCCDSVECTKPENVNPGAFDEAGNLVDDDCDGTVDNGTAACDTGLASNSGDPMDYARAIDLCRTTSDAGPGWGVISAAFALPDGSGTPHPDAHAIRASYGTAMGALRGANLALLGTGVAADADDVSPSAQTGGSDMLGLDSMPPADWLAFHGGSLPNLMGCPGAGGTLDPLMLTLRVRVPTNAHSFSVRAGFYSHEYPEWICSAYNDFFVVLLDSSYAGVPANPIDKNLATYQADDGTLYPMGVNLAFNNTGLFRECQNGPAGCAGAQDFQHTACTSTALLSGTLLDAESFGCASPELAGGGTGWLAIKGNVVPGEVITLRVAIWDSSDPVLDSFAVLDAFEWSVESADPGVVIE